MLVSQMSLEELLALPPEVQEKIVYGGVETVAHESDVAILLGGPLNHMEHRAKAAAKLYKEGKVKYILPSGAPVKKSEFGELSECDILIEYLKKEGVPEEVIIPERQALTTRENMIYAVLLLNRKSRFFGIKSVTIVSSYSHIRRSIALAKMFFPPFVKIYGYPSMVEEGLPGNWYKNDIYSDAANYEIPLLKAMIDDKQIDDIEF